MRSQDKYAAAVGPMPDNCPQTPPPLSSPETPPTPSSSETPPTSDTPPIVFVHGYKPNKNPLVPARRGSPDGHDCQNYWGDAMKFLSDRGYSDLRTVKYYSGDTNCQNGNDEGIYSSDLHDDLYITACLDYPSGKADNEGTNDESLYHLSCLFAQYLYHNFGNRSVILVGHSLGGVLMRETMYQMQENAGKSPYPPTIGHVTEAITFNTPHAGPKDFLAILACGGCRNGAEVKADSELMQELRNYGRNPQTSAGWTSWTAIGSECDPVMPAKSSIDMDASHAVVYAYDETHNTCYDHSAALHDTRVVQDAAQFYCDTTDPGNSPCGTDYKQARSSTWRSRVNGFRGIEQLYNQITGYSSTSAADARKRSRLWMVAAIGAAWKLLAS
jgi:hypothetical protein